MEGRNQLPSLTPGDKVQWTHVSQRGCTVSMVLREGTLEAIDGALAIVRTASNRQVQVAVARLRLTGQRSQIDEFVEGMREAHRTQ